MGCVSSKRTLSVADASPVLDYSYAPPPLAGNGHSSVGSSKCPSGYLNFEQKHKKDKKDGSRRKKSSYDIDNNNEEEVKEDRNTNLHGKKVKRRSSSGKSGPINLKLGFSHRHVGAEQIAAGWPSWLSSAAEEAIHGWLPLRADAFEKLEKVEQLHKIFKLCGSPSDEYWKQSKLPNATMFKAHHVHESSLRERCKDCPTTAVDLIETFLSIEPEKRGTASSALLSQYFNTMPYACDPSSLPKYTPNKEMDAKYREEARRKTAGSRTRDRDRGAPRKPRKANRTLQERNSNNKFAPKEEVKENTQFVRKINDSNAQMDKGREVVNRELNSTFDTTSETSQATKGDYVFSGPAPVIASSGFAWAKRRKEDVTSTLSYNQDISMSEISALYSSSFNFANSSFNLAKEEDERHDSQEATAKHVMQKQRRRFGSSDSFDASNLYHFNDSKATDEADALTSYPNYLKRRENIEFSGPLLSQSNKIDELLQRNESQIRQAARRSRLDRGTGTLDFHSCAKLYLLFL
ncbi:hypothetical protein P3X46_016404 [Hevea brasiliensis]|uniref:Serine/threonine-protein kinase n=1 Tax=Hevea brasiliensis TaxID=3981 RepID=A0ABQ9M167_HEVBR|nr:hypothetical protein P3X46_016404 [Hevea brasiliensis]